MASLTISRRDQVSQPVQREHLRSGRQSLGALKTDAGHRLAVVRHGVPWPRRYSGHLVY
jgi:hypothetical protein